MKTPALLALAVLGLAAGPRPSADTARGPDARILAPSPAPRVTGRVTDQADGRPLESAQVFAPAYDTGAVTDARGRYELRLPETAAETEVRIRVETLGYAPAEKEVEVSSDGATVDFELRSAALRLQELVISGVAAEIPSRAGAAPARIQLRGPRRLTGGMADAGGRVRLPFTLVDPDHGDAPPGVPGHQREAYDHIVENPFQAVTAQPLSTFSIDVDRASYANVRRFIRSGTPPPVDAVRIEELVNYFHYDYAAPSGEHPFAVHTEVAPAPWRPEHRLLKIGLQGIELDMDEAPPSNLVFLIDVSGSMQPADKLPLLKEGFRMLVEQLRPEDRVAIVVYAGAAGLVLESTPGSEKATILEALDRLRAGGSTAGGAGIRLAYEEVLRNRIEGGNNRVILATDGDFNVGSSSDGEMIRLIEEKREQGAFLTVLGFGTGNLQDAKMEKIADHGNGTFFYIDSRLEAKKALVSEMAGTLFTIAKDVKIQVEFNPTRVKGYRLIGYENRMLAAEDFDDDEKDAGELGAGHTVTALYEVVPADAESDVEIRGLEPLRYQRSSVRDGAETSPELAFVKLRYKLPEEEESTLLTHVVHDGTDRPSDDFRFAAAVAAFGMLLRGSEHCPGMTLERVTALARSGLGQDARGYRAEFLSLVGETSRHGLLAERTDRGPLD